MATPVPIAGSLADFPVPAASAMGAPLGQGGNIPVPPGGSSSTEGGSSVGMGRAVNGPGTAPGIIGSGLARAPQGGLKYVGPNSGSSSSQSPVLRGNRQRGFGGNRPLQMPNHPRNRPRQAFDRGGGYWGSRVGPQRGDPALARTAKLSPLMTAENTVWLDFSYCTKPSQGWAARRKGLSESDIFGFLHEVLGLSEGVEGIMVHTLVNWCYVQFDTMDRAMALADKVGAGIPVPEWNATIGGNLNGADFRDVKISNVGFGANGLVVKEVMEQFGEVTKCEPVFCQVPFDTVMSGNWFARVKLGEGVDLPPFIRRPEIPGVEKGGIWQLSFQQMGKTPCWKCEGDGHIGLYCEVARDVEDEDRRKAEALRRARSDQEAEAASLARSAEPLGGFTSDSEGGLPLGSANRLLVQRTNFGDQSNNKREAPEADSDDPDQFKMPNSKRGPGNRKVIMPSPSLNDSQSTSGGSGDEGVKTSNAFQILGDLDIEGEGMDTSEPSNTVIPPGLLDSALGGTAKGGEAKVVVASGTVSQGVVVPPVVDTGAVTPRLEGGAGPIVGKATQEPVGDVPMEEQAQPAAQTVSVSPSEPKAPSVSPGSQKSSGGSSGGPKPRGPLSEPKNSDGKQKLGGVKPAVVAKGEKEKGSVAGLSPDALAKIKNEVKKQQGMKGALGASGSKGAGGSGTKP